LKQIYVVAPAADKAPMQSPILGQVVLALLALAVVVLGCAPDLLLGHLNRAIKLAGF
jgi:NADH:ubiquinone oxidoreductase subunit 2 (subunit N)